jgi:hypothetical protein
MLLPPGLRQWPSIDAVGVSAAVSAKSARVEIITRIGFVSCVNPP